MSSGTPRPTQAVLPVAVQVLTVIRPYVGRIELAGSIRRRRPHVKDIEIVAVPSQLRDGLFGEERPAIPEIQAAMEGLGRRTKNGTKFIQVEDTLGSGITTDLFLVTPPAEWGPILAIRTGPASYSKMLVTRIRGRLWRCEEGRVTDDRGQHVPCPTEEDFFRAAQVEWLPPKERR